MLQIGKLSKRGPVGKERYSRFTDDELYTHITFWCLYRSPLMIGGNLPENREIERKLFTNGEVLAVNQHGEGPRQLYNKDNAMVWYSHKAGSNAVYVGLFNLGEEPQNITINFSDLGLKGNIVVRDLWKQKDAGNFNTSYQQKINKHGAALLMLSAR